MSLEDFGTEYPSEALEKHSKSLLDQYGLKACEAAAKLEDANITDGTARSYKPQVRQVVSKLDDENPRPEDVLEIISESDKKSNSKNIMVVALKKYFQQIGESDKGEELHDIAKNSGVAEIDFSREMEVEEWITKDEIDRIEKHILPGEDSVHNEINGPTKSFIITLEHKALAMTLFYTASRVGEICKRFEGDEALLVSDLYPERQQIKLYRLKKSGKGYKRDMKLVPEELFSILERYLDEYGIEKGNIFPFVKRTAQNRIQDIDQAYKFAFGDFDHMESLTPHKFRHGRVTDLANHSGLEEAGQYVEHSSTEITNAYRHLATEQQRDILPEESEGEELEEFRQMKKELEEFREIKDMMDELEEDDPEEVLNMIKELKD